MKPKLYWKPQNVSRTVIVGLALWCILGLFVVERFKVGIQQEYFSEKIAASRLAKKAFSVIRTARLERGLPIDPVSDPSKTGLIGKRMSSVTSDTGWWSAKLTSINPNFAAVIVHLLKEAGVQPGDAVAVGMSGSFPALNIATFAALETLKLHPIVISSASASQWGANLPRFLWIDMERILFRRGVFSIRSSAASIGGVDDLGAGLTESGVQFIEKAITRSKVPLLSAKDRRESLAKRLEIYESNAQGKEIKVYINVGGGIVSTGNYIGKKVFQPGLNRDLPIEATGLDSVMTHFARLKVPVIHLVSVNSLAERYGLPIQPLEVPEAGKGKIFEKEEYSVPLLLVMLTSIFGALFLFFRSEVGPYILEAIRTRK